MLCFYSIWRSNVEIKLNNTGIRIRPSAVADFYGCAYKWGKTFLEGNTYPTNSRAAIGTSIHAGVEHMWKTSQKTGDVTIDRDDMIGAALLALKEEMSERDVTFGANETVATGTTEIIKGLDAFVEDIVPFTPIPDEVESFFKIDIDHPIVAELGGTLDYLSHADGGVIADVKTSKRAAGVEGHVIQQSIYKYLVEANGIPVSTNLIQQVVLKKQPEGAILTLDTDVELVKFLINGMLDTLDLVAKDVAPIHVLLRPNPKHMYCSEKFCGEYNTCPAIKGNIANVITQVKL